jgi:prepilin-type N-terminal cleavage/methylation domain-containing protein
MGPVRRADRGFTIIEIMIVMLLIAVMSSLAIPFYLKNTARAHRTEATVVLNKVRQYFVSMYNDQGTFFSRPGGVNMAANGSVSAWNPAGAPAAFGLWNTHAAGWEDMPFPPEGQIKMRYQYTVDSANQVTMYVCGIFPGFGAATITCGDGTISGNYSYQETLQKTTPTGIVEYPSPGF